jgi:hypothetical protein
MAVDTRLRLVELLWRRLVVLEMEALLLLVLGALMQYYNMQD